MFSKNLRYYRLRSGMTKKALADRVHVTSMAITNYENGDRKPSMEILNSLAEVLGVRVSDFLAIRNDRLIFQHGEFRKNAALSQKQQEYVCKSVEEHFSRFMTVIDILGGEVLPDAPACNLLPLSDDVEKDAHDLRVHLDFSAEGPIDDLIGKLENKGILIYECAVDDNKFSGMNGFVNGRPYIIYNPQMSAERTRSTIAHELAHLMFLWPESMDEKEVEKMATAISGAFLLPRADAVRELGIRRSGVTGDLQLVAKEYGVSMLLLAMRAEVCRIITSSAAQAFYRYASYLGWRTAEPSRIEKEQPLLFEQLTYRAVSEGDISVQRGAELLKSSFEQVAEACGFGKK